MLESTAGWKLTNHHKTDLSVQCDILCNCCSSVPIACQCPASNNSRCRVSFLCRSGFGILLIEAKPKEADITQLRINTNENTQTWKIGFLINTNYQLISEQQHIWD